MYPAAVMAFKIGEGVRDYAFSYCVLGLVMIGDEHELFYKLLNMNPLMIRGIDSKNAYEFIINYPKYFIS